jgi:hypothetical protein
MTGAHVSWVHLDRLAATVFTLGGNQQIGHLDRGAFTAPATSASLLSLHRPYRVHCDGREYSLPEHPLYGPASHLTAGWGALVLRQAEELAPFPVASEIIEGKRRGRGGHSPPMRRDADRRLK